MENEKLLLLGIGAIMGGLIVLLGTTKFNYFPAVNKKWARTIGIIGIVVGLIMITISFLA